MPENTGYMIAAYVVTAVIYLFYSGNLFARARRALQGRDE
jgi:hypothetical protein